MLDKIYPSLYEACQDARTLSINIANDNHYKCIYVCKEDSNQFSLSTIITEPSKVYTTFYNGNEYHGYLTALAIWAKQDNKSGL